MTELWLLLALAYPAVFVNLGHGHNGFLTAALMGFALVTLDTRPILAGILFGLLAYKPQFGLMIPLVLVATGRWRTVFAAGATVAALVIAATLAFGMETWRAFFVFAEYTRAIVLETGETGWHKIQSVFSWARMWGAPVSLAYAIQGAVTLAVAAAHDLAVALARIVRAQGGGALPRGDPRDALQPRLRPDGAGARHRVPDDRWHRARLCSLGEERARLPVGRAADRAQLRAGRRSSRSASLRCWWCLG